MWVPYVAELGPTLYVPRRERYREDQQGRDRPNRTEGRHHEALERARLELGA